MNSHENSDVAGPPAASLRLLGVCLAFVAIDQLNDPLVDASLWQEASYWFARIGALAAGLFTSQWLVSQLPTDTWNTPSWLRPIIAVTAIGILPLVCVEVLMEPHLPIRPEFMDDDLRAVSPVLAFASEYATVATILLPIHLLLWLTMRDRRLKPEQSRAAARPEPASIPEFLVRTRAGSVDKVLALKAEEHYVKVYSDEGEDLVHHRFSGAVSEMPDALGLQVHRSWWVAERAVSSAKRGDRRWQLLLKSGQWVPISDSFIRAVRERGWLASARRPD